MNETTAARKFLRYCLSNGVRVWIAFGQDEIEGFVLKATKHTAEIQSADTGAIRTIAYAAIEEMVEAA